VKAKNVQIEIYDPTIFIDFEFAKQQPVQLVGAPAQCKAEAQPPRQMSFLEEKKLAEADVSDPGSWGRAFANKIVVKCP
jgi:ABC-type uncharacterized transport system substrate-binding protein